jgi:hypothetical protein
MEHYNSDKVDKLKKLKKEVNNLKDQVIKNYDDILDRGEKVELLVLKTKTMSIKSSLVKKRAREIRNFELWEHRK